VVFDPPGESDSAGRRRQALWRIRGRTARRHRPGERSGSITAPCGSPGTLLWFALRLGPTTFAIFDAFADEAGRQRHLAGPIAQALMTQAPTLFAAPPVIEPLDVLGAKLPA